MPYQFKNKRFLKFTHPFIFLFIFKRKMSFNFWQKCFTWGNVIAILIGLLVAFAGNSFFLELHNQGTRQLITNGDAFTPELIQLKNFLFGIIGGTIVGFHVILIFISENSLKNKEKWAWQACVAGLVCWFFIDSGCSFFYKAYHNLFLINIPAIIMLMIPLILIRKDIQK